MVTDDPNGKSLPAMYRLLELWMRVTTRLVPDPARRRWRAEWDGELWYGVAARSGARIRPAMALAVGMLRDALAVRRLEHGNGRRSRRQGDGMLRSFLTDVRYSLRMLRKGPGFAAVIVITLSLGIGATTAIFSVVNALLLNPLPYPDADRLVVLWQGRSGQNIDKDWFSAAQFIDIRDGSDVFESVTLSLGSSVIMSGRGLPAELGYMRVASSFFEMFGGAPTVGRLIDERDDQGDATTVAVLTYGLWQSAFGGEPDVAGQTITIGGRDIEIVGVLDENFLLDNEIFPTVGAIGHLDVVLSMQLSEQRMSDRGGENYNVFGRMKPGVTIEQVQADMNLVAARLTEEHESPGSGFFIRAVPLLNEVVGSVQQGLVVLFVSVGVLLLIACGNVANLLLARSNVRQRELGVRAAVGAGRGRLARQLLTESAVLGLLGGVFGVGLAVGGVALLRRVGEMSLPRLAEIGVEGNVLAFAIFTTLATTIVFGLLPALRLSGINVAEVIKGVGRGAVGGGTIWSRFNLSSGFVVAEVGLSLILLVGGGLLTRSFVALQDVDPGFVADRTLTLRFQLSGEPYSDQARRRAFVNELEERVTALPGVTSVGGISRLPFASGVSFGPMRVDGYVPPEGEGETLIADFRVVTPDYFQTMGIGIQQGRAFDERDREDGLQVAIIDQRLADKVFAARDPIGGRVAWVFNDDWMVVVGVVRSIKHTGLDDEPRFTLYQPHAQQSASGMYLTVKTAGDPQSALGMVKGVISALDDRVAVVDVSPMSQRVADSLGQRRFSMRLLQLFGLIAMILAAVGIYGLVSYRVSQGSRELGMRMALGAQPSAIVKLVLTHGMALVSAGVLLGAAGAVALSRLMTSMLFGVTATDWLTYASVSVLLVLTTLFACFIPARRATRADPLETLRAE